MAMNYYDQTTPQGASYWQPANGNTGIAGGIGGDINPEGAAADPFAYTQGSLLTPWQGRFNSSGYGGGYSAPAFTPFNYADFSYARPEVDTKFEETYADPAAFRFADFAGPSDFRAPTAEEMQSDPGYQARMNAVKNAQVAGAAHGGVLRSGGFQKGLAQAVGDQASQEYQNVYNRRASEHDRLRREAESNYGINQGNTFQAHQANIANALNAYKTRQGAWRDNADIGLRNDELGYNIATGTWDRNLNLNRMKWQDEAEHQAQLAAAANANARASYENDLGDYLRARDEFWTNQDRQYAILDREANRGLGAAQNYGNQMMGAYGAMGDYSMGGANARAGATMASGNAWGDAFQGIGDTMGGLAMYGGLYGGGSQPRNTGITGGRLNPVSYTPSYTAGITASPFGATNVSSRVGRSTYLG